MPPSPHVTVTCMCTDGANSSQGGSRGVSGGVFLQREGKKHHTSCHIVSLAPSFTTDTALPHPKSE